MRFLLGLLLLFSLFAQRSFGAILFKEQFNNDGSWESRWVQSSASGTGQVGKFKVGLGRWYGDKAADSALITTEDYRSYGISAKLDNKIPLSNNNNNKDFIVSYSFKNEQIIECGGGFIKLFGSHFNQKSISGNDEFIVAFGPDTCGTDTRHVIVRLNFPALRKTPTDIASGVLSLKKKIRFIDDHLTHSYTLIIRPDQTYSILIDGNTARFEDGFEAKGSLLNDLNIDHLSSPPSAAQLRLSDPAFIGFEFWQVKSGSVIDNVLIGDNEGEIIAYHQDHLNRSGLEERRLFGEAEKIRLDQEAKIRKEIEELRQKQEEEYENYLKEQEEKEAELKKQKDGL